MKRGTRNDARVRIGNRIRLTSKGFRILFPIGRRIRRPVNRGGMEEDRKRPRDRVGQRAFMMDGNRMANMLDARAFKQKRAYKGWGRTIVFPHPFERNYGNAGVKPFPGTPRDG